MKATEPPRLLGAADLERLGITTPDVVRCIEAAVTAAEDGRLWAAPKSVLLPADGRYVMSTLALGEDPALLVSKALVVNPAVSPGIGASVTVCDGHTGRPLAVLDGNWVTAVRTAGLSAVAARRLARAEASSIAFVGCGVQASSHLRAFAECFPLREVRALGRGTANRDRLLAAAAALGLDTVAADGPDHALDGADLVVSSITLAPDVEPFLDARLLPEGAFAAVTDLALPWLPAGLPAFDRIVIDDRAQEAGSSRPMVDPVLVSGDLVDLVTGRVPGRLDAVERTAFVFRGLALGDFALAALACDRAGILEGACLGARED